VTATIAATVEVTGEAVGSRVAGPDGLHLDVRPEPPAEGFARVRFTRIDPSTVAELAVAEIGLLRVNGV
jgi:hypothetical protein